MKMQLNVDEAILARVREIGPVVREHAAEAERERRLSPVVYDLLNDTGLTRMFVPRSLGGLETDPLTCARVVEELSTFDSAAAWALQTNTNAFVSARLEEAGAREIYDGNPNALGAAAFQPPVPALQVADGYRLQGRRSLASHVSASRWTFVTAIVMSNGTPKLVAGNPVVLGAFVPTAEVRVLDTWYALGMRGTDSADIELADVLVPTRRTFAMTPAFEPNRLYRGPLYRIPLLAVSPGVTIAPVSLGIARLAIEDVRSLAATKTPFASATTMQDRGTTQAKLGLAEAELGAARALLYGELEDCWARAKAGEPSSTEQRARVLMAATHAVQTSARVADSMYALCGSTGVFAANRIERSFRDAQVIRQHGLASERRYETIGQVYLGLPPDLPFVYF
jgi:indole-3-acetate monooxygenase